MSAYTEVDAEALIRAARSGIELYIRSPHFHTDMVDSNIRKYNSNEDVTIRLLHYATRSVRGISVGNNKTLPLYGAVVGAALSAAFGQQNHVPISENELEEIIIELSIMSEPRDLSRSFINRRSEIEIGKHGLIIQYGMRRAVLLPSYAVERGLDRTKFLESACTEAGLEKDYWKQPRVNLYKFEAQTFIEQSPNGKVKIL